VADVPSGLSLITLQEIKKKYIGTDLSPNIWTAGIRLPVGAKDISLLHSVQTGFGAHPASYAVSTKVKRGGANQSPQSSAEVKNGVVLN
jgi:hypothetical protein